MIISDDRGCHDPHLGEELLEVLVHELGALGYGGQGGVIAHGPQGLVARVHHRQQQSVQ